MYLSSINDDVDKKIDDILKWFLFSNKNDFEKIIKSKISIERLIVMKEIGSYGIKDVRRFRKILKFKFLIDSITKDNNYKIIIEKRFEEIENKFKIKTLKEIQTQKITIEDLEALSNSHLISDMLIKLKCDYEFRNLNGTNLTTKEFQNNTLR